MSTAHTSGPYELGDFGLIKFRGTIIAQAEGFNRAENAQAIVTAMNCHYELLNACKEAHTMLGEYLIDTDQEAGAINELHNQLWEAIKKARGNK